MRKLAAGCYAVLLVFLVAAPAAARQAAPPQYQSSEPDAGATVHQPPDRVEVTFDQPLDQNSSLSVTDECDHRVDDGTTEVSGSTMSIGLEKKPAGRYTVEYVARGIGGLTGQEEDSFTFTAHAGDSCGSGSSGHKNHNNGHNNNNGHGMNHNNGNHNSGNHSNGEHEGTDHGSGSTHSGTDHAAMGSTHTDHDSSSTSHDGGHGSGEHNKSVATGPETIDGITSSDTQPGLLTRADSTTLLISLALCAALGILGGVVLRATNAK